MAITTVFCCRAGDETRGLDLEEQEERQRFPVNLPASLAGVHTQLANLGSRNQVLIMSSFC